MMLFLLLFYFVFCPAVDGRLTVRPGNTAVVVGSRAVLRCSTDMGSVNWTYRPTGAAITSHVYMNEVLYDVTRFSVDTNTSTGQFDLVVLSASVSIAGLYSCRDDGGEEGRAELVVVSEPSCGRYNNHSNVGFVVEGELLTLRCAVNFTGFTGKGWPGMSWVDSTGTGVRQEPVQQSVAETNYTALDYNWKSDLINSVFFCTIQFYTGSKRFPQTFVNSSLSDHLTCSVSMPEVQFSTRNIRILISSGANGTIHQLGDRLWCMSDGNPGARYEWTDSTDVRWLVHGPGLTLTDVGEHEYQCRAYNVVRNVTYSQTMTIFVVVIGDNGRSSMGTTWIIAIATLSALAMLVVVVTAVAVCLTRRARTYGSCCGQRDDLFDDEVVAEGASSAVEWNVYCVLDAPAVDQQPTGYERLTDDVDDKVSNPRVEGRSTRGRDVKSRRNKQQQQQHHQQQQPDMN